MAMQILGEYKTSPPEATTDGERVRLQVDANGNLKTVSSYKFSEGWNLNYGTGSTYGKKNGTVANGAYLYVALDCSDFPVSGVDWAITSDQQYNYRLFRSHQNELSATITLTDATAVDNGDTFTLNGLTFEAVTGASVAAERKFGLGANNAACAVNLATLLLDATYGLPGLQVAAVTSPTTTDVITLACDAVTALQFGQGTSDANEIAWAETTLTGLWADAAQVADVPATTGTRGNIVHQTDVNGWEWCFLQLQNDSGSAAANFEVRALRF